MKAFMILCIAASISWGAWQRSGDTVIDTTAKLQWQDTRENAERESVWRDAKGYCANLSLAGFYDWRLPTRSELKSLAEAEHNKAVKINYAEASPYWTSEVYKKDPINVWAVFWDNGHAFDDDQCDTAHVRCVRDR